MSAKLRVEDAVGNFLVWEYESEEKLMQDLSTMVKTVFAGFPGIKITIEQGA